MAIDDSNWSYEEFLAFIMVYAARMNTDLSPAELEFIKQRTGIKDIEKIKAKVDSSSDIEAIEKIEHCKKRYLDTPEKESKARKDLEELLKTDSKHTQLEKVLVHIIEKLL